MTDPLDQPWQDLRSILAAPVDAPEKAPARPPLTRAQKWLVGMVSGFVTIIAGIGFAGSYTAVTKLAAAKGFGWFAWAFPAGVDSGIGGFLALDLLLTWLRIPYPLLRQIAWCLTAATICFNASSAWPDPLAVGMHATIPLLFIAAVEGARHAVGRIADITADQHMESPPLIRWIIAPWPTFRIWRRMRLWHLPSYTAVIEQQKELKIYRARLRSDYGRRWRRDAPADRLLVFELAHFGTSVSDALAAPEAEAEAHRAAEVERRAEALRQAEAETEAAREAEERQRAEAEARRISEAEAEAKLAGIARAQRIADAETEARIAAVEAERHRAFQAQQAQEAEAKLQREQEMLRVAQERSRLEAEAAKPKPKRGAEAARSPKPKPTPGAEAKSKPAAIGGKRTQVETEVEAVLALIQTDGYDAVGLERVKADFGLKHAAAYDRLLKARDRYRKSA